MRSKIIYILAFIILGALAYIGIEADNKSFIGSLFAAFFSAFIVLFIEKELRPKIKITEEDNSPDMPDGRKFLRVIVKNCALSWPLNLLMDRRPAYQTRAWITFLMDSNDLVFSKERQMIGRWSSTPEPVRPISITKGTGGNPQVTFLRDLSITRDAVDIGSGASEPLDIVMRSPNKNGCLGWHNRIIQNPKINPEDNFELSKGRYRALVRVETSGRSFKALFRIVCDRGIEDFRLERIDKIPKSL